MTNPPDLKDAGRAYLGRWQRYLAAHPDADPKTVNRAMLAGEPPPDAEQQAAVEADAQQASQQRQAHRRDEIETSLQVVSSLTAVDRRFTAAVLMGHNLKDAYLYANPNYEGDNARKLGWQRRQKPEVQAAIDDYFHRQEMTPRRAVALLSEKAEFDLTRYMRFVRDEDGRITDAWVDAEAIRDDGLGHLVKGTKYDKDGRLLFEFEGSLRPLEDIMRFFGLFTDKTDLTSGGKEIQPITIIREDRNAGDAAASDETE